MLVEIVCGACGSEDLTRDPDGQLGDAIPLLCLSCGWRGTRTPTVSCSRCGSTDVDQIPVDNAWAYVDNEEAADDPGGAQWGYFEKTNFRCRNCHKEWSTAGEFRPYQGPEGSQGARTHPARLDEIWARIKANASCPFFTKTGVSFTYEVEGSSLYLQNTNRVIPKSAFAAALDRFPVAGPGELQDLQGPSYLFGILTDPRIR